jgi:hypothetical protein
VGYVSYTGDVRNASDVSDASYRSYGYLNTHNSGSASNVDSNMAFRIGANSVYGDRIASGPMRETTTNTVATRERSPCSSPSVVLDFAVLYPSIGLDFEVMYPSTIRDVNWHDILTVAKQRALRDSNPTNRRP